MDAYADVQIRTGLPRLILQLQEQRVYFLDKCISLGAVDSQQAAGTPKSHNGKQVQQAQTWERLILGLERLGPRNASNITELQAQPCRAPQKDGLFTFNYIPTLRNARTHVPVDDGFDVVPVEALDRRVCEE